jgi:hypothetical protein
MTDQGSTRASVSIAWRLLGLRPCGPLVEPRFCQAEVIELANPAAAPLTAEAAPDEDPTPDEYPFGDREPAPGPPAADAGPGAGAGAEALTHSDRV